MQTMSPLDASFLRVENAVTHMHIGSVGIFEGPATGPDEVQIDPHASAARGNVGGGPVRTPAGTEVLR